MKNHKFMSEKYLIFNQEPKVEEFPIPEGFECFRVCRYGDGYVYRVLKVCTEIGEIPCQGYIYLFSVTKQELYATDLYEQIKIYMIDFEHGCPYVTAFEFLHGDDCTRVDCDSEVWCDEDMEKLPITIYRKTHDKQRKNYKKI